MCLLLYIFPADIVKKSSCYCDSVVSTKRERIKIGQECLEKNQFYIVNTDELQGIDFAVVEKNMRYEVHEKRFKIQDGNIQIGDEDEEEQKRVDNYQTNLINRSNNQNVDSMYIQL